MSYNFEITAAAATIAAPAVTFDRASLFAALEFINKHIVERRHIYPILDNVLIEATSDGMARLIATDLDLEAVITIPADWAMPGAFSVCAATLRDIVKKARAFSGEVRLSYNNGFVIVNAGRTRQRLVTAPSEDFPRLAATELPLSWECDAATLAADIALLSPAISKEKTRYYLNGIFMHARGDGVLRMAATNGHIMSTVARPAPIAAMEWEGVIMPRKAVAAMAAAIKDQESAALSFSASKFRVVAGNIELYSKLIDGTFPDYARVLRNATGGAAALAVTGPELAAHCKMAVKTSTHSRSLTLELSANGCRAGQAGYANPLSAEYDGDGYVIAFNAIYLEPLAKQLGDIIMQGAPFDDARGDVCSMLLTSPSAPHWTGCIMPLRDFAPLPAPFAPRYIETMPAPGQAADLFDVERATNIGSSTCYGKPNTTGIIEGSRPATAAELEAYARDYAARLGHVDAAANWVFSIAKINADGQVVAVEFDAGHADDRNRLTILLPGYGQDKQLVTVEIMDDAGEYAAPMACTNGKGDIAMPDAKKIPKRITNKKAMQLQREFEAKEMHDQRCDKHGLPKTDEGYRTALDIEYAEFLAKRAAAPAPASEPATVAPVSAELVQNSVRAALLAKVGGLETFTRFWSWRSHVAEKRAEEALFSAESMLVQGQAALAAANADNATMTAWADRFFKHWHAYMVAGSRTANPMITGPANFPVARNQKAIAREMALGDAYWQFTNSTQEFMRRIERSKEKAALSAISSNTNHKTTPFVGGNLVYNTTLDRVQLVFDAKPADDHRVILKKAAFRWSPRENAWQRQLTNAGIYAANLALKNMGLVTLLSNGEIAAQPAIESPQETPAAPEIATMDEPDIREYMAEIESEPLKLVGNHRNHSLAATMTVSEIGALSYRVTVQHDGHPRGGDIGGDDKKAIARMIRRWIDLEYDQLSAALDRIYDQPDYSAPEISPTAALKRGKMTGLAGKKSVALVARITPPKIAVERPPCRAGGELTPTHPPYSGGSKYRATYPPYSGRTGQKSGVLKYGNGAFIRSIGRHDRKERAELFGFCQNHWLNPVEFSHHPPRIAGRQSP